MRLAYDELLASQLALLLMRNQMKRESGVARQPRGQGPGELTHEGRPVRADGVLDRLEIIFRKAGRRLVRHSIP